MGFGWLLVGYFFANIMSLYRMLAFAMLVGYPMMIYGLYRLTPYHTYFRFGFFFSFASLPFAVYFSMCGFSELLLTMDFAFLSGTFYTVMEWLYFVFSLVFHLLLLMAIAGIAKELRLVAVQSSAWRNMIMVLLYYLLDGVARSPIPWIQEHRSVFSLSLILLRICFVLFNMYLIFQCYKRICPEGDQDMPDPVRSKKKKIEKDTDAKEGTDHAQ